MSKIDQPSASIARRLWIALFFCVLAAGFVFSVIQPLIRTPDEYAHMQYIKFLARERRLPVWQAQGGGEAGYESQHPPLYYAAGAVVYTLTKPLPENWRWHILRWSALLLGALLFLIARGFFTEYFNGRFGPAFAATAAFTLTPLTLMYNGYINVDGPAVLWCSLILWMSMRVARGHAGLRDRIILSVALGFGLLTKLTVLGVVPVVILAHLWDPQVDISRRWEQRRLRLLSVLLGAAVISGWHYVRSSLLYGSPFIHTTGRFGSGLFLAENTGEWGRLIWFTFRESYLSLWAQRGWLPPGLTEITLYALLTLLILLSIGGGAKAKLVRESKPSTFDPAPWLCAALLLSLIVGHQMQVWFVDYEFNAGGRYLLNGLMGVNALIVSGLMKLGGRKVWLTLWVTVFVLMNLVSANHIWSTLNPKHAPGWRIFQFPPAATLSSEEIKVIKESGWPK